MSNGDLSDGKVHIENNKNDVVLDWTEPRWDGFAGKYMSNTEKSEVVVEKINLTTLTKEAQDDLIKTIAPNGFFVKQEQVDEKTIDMRNALDLWEREMKKDNCEKEDNIQKDLIVINTMNRANFEKINSVVLEKLKNKYDFIYFISGRESMEIHKL